MGLYCSMTYLFGQEQKYIGVKSNIVFSVGNAAKIPIFD